MMNIYTDGSCEPNPGIGGWGFVVAEDGYFQQGAEPETTCNRMEMMAILRALRFASRGARIVIHSDSMLCVNVLSGKWKGRANRDLVDRIAEASDGKEVEYRWVRGHNGDRWNERADELAEAARLLSEDGEMAPDVCEVER